MKNTLLHDRMRLHLAVNIRYINLYVRLQRAYYSSGSILNLHGCKSNYQTKIQ